MKSLFFKKSFHLFLCLINAGTFVLTGQTPNTEKTSYTEKHRPQFHFSPQAHWMNDPNGLCWYDGEYHLFYQYYPEASVWGPMHWGHAVSQNLIHWKHLAVAIKPDSLGYIFSGSAVVDARNTTGFGVGNVPPIVAIFTHHDPVGEKAGTLAFQNQSIAWSTDRGRTFSKFTGNPVVKNPGIRDFRDPKVIWHEESNRWIMVLAAYDKVMMYSSPDLKKWEYASSFGIAGDTRLWECPDLIPMKVTESGENKWVLLASIQNSAPNGGTATSYFVGDFDGKEFRATPSSQQWLDYGTDNYAMVTWSNNPDNRTLALGWMSNWQYAQQVPTEKWRSAMTLPRELTLHKEGSEYRLYSTPVAEMRNLQNSEMPDLASNIHTPGLIYDGCNLSRMGFSLQKLPVSDIQIRFSNDKNEELLVGYDHKKAAFYIDRRNAGEKSFHPDFAGRHFSGAINSQLPFTMEIFLDNASVELFGQNGRTAMTDIFFPSSPFTKAELLCHPDDAAKGDMKVWRLNSIWK